MHGDADREAKQCSFQRVGRARTKDSHRILPHRLRPPDIDLVSFLQMLTEDLNQVRKIGLEVLNGISQFFQIVLDRN